MHDGTISILVVDDLPANLFAMQQMLKPLDVETVTAQGAHEGLRLLLRHDIDIVMLDYSMPEMNGLEMAELINNQYAEPPPILFVTAHGHNITGLENKCYALGAIDFIEKPIKEEVLLAKLNVLITLVKQREEMRRLATIDLLTQLPNRLAFQEAFQQNLSLASRQDAQLGLLAFDLDDFKGVNDRYGHDAGDAVLAEFSKRLKTHIRNSDYAARLGGDEFVCLLTNIHSEDEVEDIANKLLRACNGNFDYQGRELTILSSIGAAMYPYHGDSPELLFKAADIALYEAKSAGKGVARMCSTDDHITMGRDTLSSRFKLGYQPMYDSSSTQIIGGEIFSRINNAADYGGTREAIEHLRHLGQSKAFEKTLREKLIGDLEEDGADPAMLKGVQLFMNQSTRELTNTDLNNNLMILHNHLKLKNIHLILDILDWEDIRSQQMVVKHLNMLKGNGVGICIQDVGNMAIPIALLRDVRPHFVKISRTLIGELGQRDDSIRIIESIVSIADNIGSQVIAVGIEQESQFDLLKDMGIQHFQGYFRNMDLSSYDFKQQFNSTTQTRVS